VPVQLMTSRDERGDVDEPNQPLPVVSGRMEAQEDEGVVRTSRIDRNIKHVHELGSSPYCIHWGRKGVPIRQQFPMEIDPPTPVHKRGLGLIAKVKRLPLRCQVANGLETALDEAGVCTPKVRQPNQQVDV